MNGSLPAEFHHGGFDLIATDAATDWPAGRCRQRGGLDPWIAKNGLDSLRRHQPAFWKQFSGSRPRVITSDRYSADCGTLEACLSRPTLPASARGGGEPDGLPQREVPRHHGQHPRRAAATGCRRASRRPSTPRPARRPAASRRSRRSKRKPVAHLIASALADFKVLPISRVIMALDLVGLPSRQAIVSIATINPATGETVKKLSSSPRLLTAKSDAAIARAHQRFPRLTTVPNHLRPAGRMGQRHRRPAREGSRRGRRHDDPGNGQDLKSARAEAIKCATVSRYYAENAEKLLADEPAEAVEGRARSAPTTPVAAARRGAGRDAVELPAVGKAVRSPRPPLIGRQRRPAQARSNVPQSALYLSDVITRGGFPENCFQNAAGVVRRLSRPFLRDPRVKAATVDRQRTGRPVGSRHLWR